jgi:hypothetical protein
MRRLVAVVGRFLLILFLSAAVLALVGWIIAALTDRGVQATIALAFVIGGAVPVVGWAIGGAQGPRANPVGGHITGQVLRAVVPEASASFYWLSVGLALVGLGVVLLVI